MNYRQMPFEVPEYVRKRCYREWQAHELKVAQLVKEETARQKNLRWRHEKNPKPSTERKIQEFQALLSAIHCLHISWEDWFAQNSLPLWEGMLAERIEQKQAAAKQVEKDKKLFAARAKDRELQRKNENERRRKSEEWERREQLMRERKAKEKEAQLHRQNVQRKEAEKRQSDYLATQRAPAPYGYSGGQLPRQTRRRSKAEATQDLLDQRLIERLVHFTPYSNLDSILEYGLRSRSWLTDQKVGYVWTDDERIDGRLDYISVSISHPNHKMFYTKREGMACCFCVLEIDSTILVEADCLYFQENAASNEYLNRPDLQFSRFADLEALFGQPRPPGLSQQYTSRVQSEVLIKNSVPLSRIRAFHFGRRGPEFDRTLARTNIPCLESPDLFQPHPIWKLKNG